MRHGSRAVCTLIAVAGAGSASIAAQNGADVTATVTGLRSNKGHVVACLTAKAAAFPDCVSDAAAFTADVPAASSVTLDFHGVPPGDYAISLFHDENSNRRLDTRLMIPREGYGFSRDAPVRFGPPAFSRAAFAVGSANQHQTIRMRYLF